MDELFKYFFGLHKRTKFFAVLLGITLILPSLYVIAYVFFEEYIKYNLANIIVLAFIVNVLLFVWIFGLSNGVMEVLQYLENKYHNLTAVVSKRLANKRPELTKELKDKVNSDIIDRNMINTSFGLFFIAVFVCYKYGSTEAPSIELNTKNLMKMFFNDINLVSLVIGILNYRSRRKMYNEAVNNNISDKDYASEKIETQQ